MNQWNDEWLASYQRRLRTAPPGQITRARKEYVQAVADTMAQAPKPSKYRNVKCEVDGEKFDSKAEARRYQDLLLLQAGGKIGGLKRQAAFPLIVAGVTVCAAVWDFYYREAGREVVEDVKSPATAKNRAYRIKRKLFEALYPTIEFREMVAA